MKTLKVAVGVVVALASLPRAGVAGEPEPRIEVHADLQNLTLFRNDADFDPTLPLYSASGRSVGAFATVLRPDVTWHIAGNLRLFYEAEVGLNYWGKQSPDQESAASPDVFVMKHRELYGEGFFDDGRWGFKAGYSHFLDPTGLFLNHWIGVAQGRWAWSEKGRAELFFGQVPDQIYEGINVGENNFRRDIFAFGANATFTLAEGVTLSAGLNNLYDDHAVDQTRWVVGPAAHLEARSGALTGMLDVAVQAGRAQGAALGGEDQSILGWAVQGRVQHDGAKLQLQGNVLALSPDDDHSGNDVDRAFLYSGKSRSATLMLTEDELRDWYDNLDERMAAYRDGFFVNRAGLMVADVKATWAATERFRPAVVLGVATTLNAANALGSGFVGVEGDLVLEYRLDDHLVANAAAGVLLPGAAGAALVNRIDLGRTDPMLMLEGSLLLHY